MRNIIIIITLVIFINPLSFAQNAEPPSPQQVYDDMLKLWKDYQFEELEQYINSLYDKYPNYIPAILAKSFYDYIYEGKLLLAQTKLISIKQYLEPRLTPELQMFYDECLIREMKALEEEIKDHREHGRNPENLVPDIPPNEVAEIVRDECNNIPPAILIIIPDAPAMFIDESTE